MTQDSRLLAANGVNLRVIDAGEGEPVLLLHGFPDTADLWDAQIHHLTAHGFRAIAPDLRGRGASDKPAGVAVYALSMIAEDLVALLDVLEIERAHVVGHDWGAAVAWLLAALYPQRMNRLVAISVGFPGAGGRPTLEALQKGWYRLLFQFTGVAEQLVRQDDWYLLREMLQSYPDVDACIATLAEPGALTAGLNWYRANLPPERLLGGRNRLPNVQAPTLGVFGAHDLYLTETAMQASAEKVAAPWRYERFADAGHWLMLEEPERFNRLLLEFLSGSD